MAYNLDTGNSYPCPIFSILVYFRLGSPTETIVRSFSRISSSVIFFFLVRSFFGGAAGFSSGSTGFVYYKYKDIFYDYIYKLTNTHFYMRETIQGSTLKALYTSPLGWWKFSFYVPNCKSSLPHMCKLKK